MESNILKFYKLLLLILVLNYNCQLKLKLSDVYLLAHKNWQHTYIAPPLPKKIELHNNGFQDK